MASHLHSFKHLTPHIPKINEKLTFRSVKHNYTKIPRTKLKGPTLPAFTLLREAAVNAFLYMYFCLFICTVHSTIHSYHDCVKSNLQNGVSKRYESWILDMSPAGVLSIILCRKGLAAGFCATQEGASKTFI